MKNIGRITFILLVLMIFKLASAQDISSLSMTVSPPSPEPNKEVTIKISSFSTDLERDTISWYKDGSRVLRGIGETEYTFKTGAAGSTTKISVVINKRSGGTLEDSVIIRPASVDLIWESDTYVPNWYPGFPLHSSESDIRVVAFPRLVSGGSLVDPNELVYNWTRNNKPLASQSGFGKKELLLRGAKLYGQDLIQVDVSTLDQRVSATGFALIKAMDPEIYFYKVEDLGGLDNSRELNGLFDLLEKEGTIKAEPFFFSKNDMVNDKLNYQWVIDGESYESRDPLKVNFRHENEAGISSVSLTITNTIRALQRASRGFIIKFNESF